MLGILASAHPLEEFEKKRNHPGWATGSHQSQFFGKSIIISKDLFFLFFLYLFIYILGWVKKTYFATIGI
jgi:hypothetical protein